MTALYVPLWKRSLGGAAGWIAFASLRVLFALPRPLLGFKLAAVAFLLKAFGGDSPSTRSAADLRDIIGRGSVGADVLARIATRSRSADIVGIVRGAVIRSLP